MKLFKSLLVAPATLGLLAPMAATANEVTISDFTPAEELAITNSRVDGLEARMNNIEAGSFSETTTASFSADMIIGAVDGGTATTDDAVEAYYGFQIDLNTSFTGEDSLDISIDAGNAGGAVSEFDLNGGVTTASSTTTTDILTVDGVSYTFPVGSATVIVGDNTDGSALFSTACVYGGPSNTLDDCGNVNAGITGGGTAIGASYDFGNGFTAAVGYAGTGASTSRLMTKEGLDVFGGQVTYTGDSYGVSVTYSDYEGTNDTAYTAFNAYYTPDSAGSLPSISVGYETGNKESATVTDTSQFMVGLQWDEVGAGTLGVALATDGHMLDTQPERYVYEAFYSYPVNDGMTITPIVFIREASSTVDETGVVLKTSFSF